MLVELKRLSDHAAWADRLLADALVASNGEPGTAVREFAHVLGTSETWLARIEGRPPTLAVWPELAADQLMETVSAVHRGYQAFLSSVTEGALGGPIRYVNSAGQRFENRLDDLLLHAALHGQYHRGKINLLLRQSGRQPIPTDYIAFIRGVPAAITKPR